MASKTVTVGSSVGLHARPASLIAEAAAGFDEEILLTLVGSDDDEETDASSSLMIMALGAENGDQVTVTSDNAEAVEKIAAMIEQDLDAE
ncbi:HPr family phosphocarrier protein [Corynebacterium gallinarum]|uniref:Phosphocarrier protein HPr n=1 Tax=Corynebacterium gallinarum TaxID=2762214 RepID=A0A8I0LGL3_9CORY|nr:HPr family phosphocarrier protein [Corynebacterium gallinarum]MBD8028730.1 HPr family phosphocarrier protein [Corynebacterium gallinarum]